MIKIKNIQKHYGDFLALHDISFDVHKGEVLALLGPNGAGKTTTMKIMTGFLESDTGEVTINGEVVSDETRSDIQQKIGYLPENAPLYPDLNVYEHLDFSATIHGLEGPTKQKAITRVVETCGLKEKLFADITELSKGYKQRVGLAQSLIHDPSILILDEPTTGLDPNQIIEIRNFIDELRKDKTIILSTHIMQEVEALADRVVVVNKGNVVAEGTPESLQKGKGAAHRTRVVIHGSAKKAKDTLEKTKHIEDIFEEAGSEKGTHILNVFTSEDIRPEIAQSIVKANIGLLEMTSQGQSMEDVFQELTKE